MDKETLSMALANFIYREVVEDAHSQYEISQYDMQCMNKMSVNRARFFVDLLDDETKLETFTKLYSLPVFREWDKPEKDSEIKSIEKIIDEVNKTGRIF